MYRTARVHVLLRQNTWPAEKLIAIGDKAWCSVGCQYEHNIHRALIGKRYRQLIHHYSCDSETARSVYRLIEEALETVAGACNH